MRISALTIRDFKGIREVSLDTDRELILVAGKNGAGKSSALDAITVLLMGKDAMPAEPIRRGSDSGEIVAKLDGFIVKRTFTRKEDGTFGGSLTITSPDGAKYPSPQGWLDARINALGCDPIAFMASKPAEQAETLRKIAGVDVTAIDAARKSAFDSRTEIGRVGKLEVGALDAMPHYDDAPDTEVEPEVVSPALVTAPVVSAAAIADELSAAQRTVESKASARRLADEKARQHVEAEQRAAREAAEIDRMLAEIAARQAALTNLQTAAQIANAAATEAASAAAALPVIDPAPIRERLTAVEQTNAAAAAEAAAKNAAAVQAANEANAAARKLAAEVNAKVRANAARKVQAEKVAAGRAAYAAKTAEIAALDTQRANLLAAAKFPVDGLGFATDGTVTFDGIPLAQANEATKIRVSMAIALAGDKPGKIVLIRNGSQLDEDSMALVADLAHTAGAQLFIERVGTGDAGAVVIKDGGVA